MTLTRFPSKEINIRSDLLANPITGEVVEIDGPTHTLAEWLRDVREFESRMRELKGVVTDEITTRLDRANTGTLREDGWEIKAPRKDTKTEWDVEQLEYELTTLVTRGVLTEEAAREALTPSRELKPQAVKLKALSEREDIGDRISACSHQVPQARTVSVKELRAK